MDDAHFEEVLDTFDNFCDDGHCFLFAEFPVLSEVLEQISFWAVLGDDVAVGGVFVDVFQLEYVGVAEFFEDGDLVLQHLQAGICIFLDIDHF